MQQHREQFYREAAGIAQKYTADVKSTKAYDFKQQGQQFDEKTDKALEILQRLDEFDPLSKDLRNYNDELRLNVSLLQALKG